MKTNETAGPYNRLLIDLGNTCCKTAFARDKTIGVIIRSRDGADPQAFLRDVLGDRVFDVIAFSSVQTYDPALVAWLASKCGRLIVVDGDTPTALRIDYRTADRLGADLLAAGAGAVICYPGQDLLVIGFGTAITYTLIDRERRFLGVNISPGFRMRFKALHRYTHGLPLIALAPDEEIPDAGIDTRGALTAGVVRGIVHEIEGYIDRNPGKKVIFTGGDTNFFAGRLKIPIFVNCNLIFTGLAEIAHHHA